MEVEEHTVGTVSCPIDRSVRVVVVDLEAGHSAVVVEVGIVVDYNCNFDLLVVQADMAADSSVEAVAGYNTEQRSSCFNTARKVELEDGRAIKYEGRCLLILA